MDYLFNLFFAISIIFIFICFYKTLKLFNEDFYKDFSKNKILKIKKKKEETSSESRKLWRSPNESSSP